jgi:hypothetical protein
VLKLNDGAVRPEFAANFFPGHKIAGPCQEHGKDSKRLFRKLEGLLSLAAEFARSKVQLKTFESGYPSGIIGFFQTGTPQVAGFYHFLEDDQGHELAGQAHFHALQTTPPAGIPLRTKEMFQ